MSQIGEKTAARNTNAAKREAVPLPRATSHVMEGSTLAEPEAPTLRPHPELQPGPVPALAQRLQGATTPSLQPANQSNQPALNVK
jgi:hypothetical protein